MNEFIMRIPRSLYLAFDNPTEREVFFAVYLHTNNGSGECWASQRSIASISQLSQDTVKRYLPLLVNHGFLKVSGSRSVRGGVIPKYALSERWSFSSLAEVNDTASEVNDRPPTETYKGNIKKETDLKTIRLFDLLKKEGKDNAR